MYFPSLSNLSLLPSQMPEENGVKRRKTLPRTANSGLVKLLRTQDMHSLDVNGVASLGLPRSIDTAAFVATVGEATNTWFHSNLDIMLRFDSHEPGHRSSMFYGKTGSVLGDFYDIYAAYSWWDVLPADEKKEIKERIDLRTPLGMQLLFDSGSLDKHPQFKEKPWLPFFKKAMRFVKMGNTGYGQANMPNSWVSDGFGLWAHIAADVGFPMLVEAIKLLESYGLKPGLPKGFPHPIYKPPTGSALDIHHDQMPPLTLIENLRAHGNGSWTAWVRQHGFQLLAHLDGGTGIDDGATFVVGPMTPAALLVCMETYNQMPPMIASQDGKNVNIVEEWRNKKSGPWFLDWEQHLNTFNAALKAAGHPTIGLIPGAPQPAHRRGHMILWPVGYPHGSFSNPKGSRLTVTLPITVAGSGQLPDPRLPSRLRHLATLSSNGHTMGAYQEAQEWLAEDGKMTKEQRKLVNEAGVKRMRGFGPYSDGKTHENPFKAIDQIRSPDAARLLNLPVGPFWEVSVKPATLATYNEALARVAAGESLLDPSHTGPSGTAPAELQRDASMQSEGPDRLVSEDEDEEMEQQAQEEQEGDESDDEPLRQRQRRLQVDNSPFNPTLNAATAMVTPPTAAILDQRGLKIVKVRMPWADDLVTGKKNVENRRWPLSQQLAGANPKPEWLLIASSKSVPTEEMMRDYRWRLDRQYPGGRPKSGEQRADFVDEGGAIVGLVLIQGCYTADRMPIKSVWYNGAPDLGWVVKEAWQFDDPVVLAEDDKFQTQVELSNRPRYLDRLRTEIGKLEPVER